MYGGASTATTPRASRAGAGAPQLVRDDAPAPGRPALPGRSTACAERADCSVRAPVGCIGHCPGPETHVHLQGIGGGPILVQDPPPLFSVQCHAVELPLP